MATPLQKRKLMGEINTKSTTGALSSSIPRLPFEKYEKMRSKFFFSSPLIAPYSTAAFTSGLIVITRVEMPPPMLYGAIDEIFEALGAIARERGWNIDKRLDIARLACERSELTFGELEELYDQGVRSLLGRKLQRAADSSDIDESSQ